MKKRLAFYGLGRLRFRCKNPFPIQFITDVVKHIPEIFFAAVTQIILDILFLFRSQGSQCGFRTGGRGGIDRDPQLRQDPLLLFRKIQPHPEEQHEIEVFAKSRDVERIGDAVREESLILNQLKVQERKEIRDEFYNLNEAFKKSLSIDQLKMYKQIEAYGVLFNLSNERPK